jgi:uncharacterized sporulation protein YeaH/YhbH (DUF444 family)
MKYFDLTVNKHKKISDSVNLFRKRLKYLLSKESIKVILKDTSNINAQDGNILIDSLMFDLPFIYKKRNSDTIVLTKNTVFTRGDFIKINRNDGDGEDGGEDSDEQSASAQEKQFIFEKFEILKYLFQDWTLPNLESTDDSISTEAPNISGLSKSGPITRIHLQKTIKNAMARKIASEASKEESEQELDIYEECPIKSYTPFLDETDIVYKHVTRDPEPKSRAVLFCVMDVSGSMEKEHRRISYDVFYYIYNFIKYKYHDDLDLVFISHTEDAWEVTEKEFFLMRGSGGTRVQKVYTLINSIIKERFFTCPNIYITHMSDGDVIDAETTKVRDELKKLSKSCKLLFFGLVQPKLPGYSEYNKNAIVNSITLFINNIKNGVLKTFTSRDSVLPELHKTFNKN